VTRPPPDDYADSEAQTLVYSAPRLNLCGTVGPLRGRVYTSDGNTVLIGRGEACTIVLLVAGISRQHARIDYRNGHYWVVDLGTLNGTFVNGKLLDHPRQLDEGDRILICNQEFVVRFGEMDRDELLRRREGSVARPITSPGLHTPRGTALPTSSPDEGTVKVQMPVAEPQPVGKPNSHPPGQRPPSKPAMSKPATQPPPSKPATRPPSQPPTTKSISQPGISRPVTEDSLPRALTQPPISNTPYSRPIALPPVVHSPTPSPFHRTQPSVRFTAPRRKIRFHLTPQAKRIVLIGGVAMGVIVLSVLASIIAVRWFGPAPQVVTVPVESPRPTSPIVTPVMPQQPLPATLEAEGLTHLTSSTDGVVRRAVTEGTSVRAGQPLCEAGQASPDVERKRAKLAELEAKYGRSPDYADFIAQARDEYEKAARRSGRAVLTAPHGGIVTRQRVRVGDTIHRGDDLIELATRVRLIVATGSVEGNASACKVTLLDRQDSVILGRMVPFPPDARVRTLLVDRLPPGLPLGAVGKVRVTCQ
jgi:pSer/pThr/pTyr-binding forkhead associated (FHA) protein/biotin carboxyl carrier protein